MNFNTIYKNGKPQYFFIELYFIEEFNFLQPYFILTSADHPRFSRILEMNCLFSGSVYYGRQQHGYGYSCCKDVYDSLIAAIKKLHKNKLSDDAIEELNDINTYNDTLNLSAALLAELKRLNHESF